MVYAQAGYKIKLLKEVPGISSPDALIDADLYPNLRYNAVNDKRTRDAHRALDGLILPINHEFWKKHSVPLDWGCRCNLEQTDEEPSKTVPEILVKGAFKNKRFKASSIA